MLEQILTFAAQMCALRSTCHTIPAARLSHRVTGRRQRASKAKKGLARRLGQASLGISAHSCRTLYLLERLRNCRLDCTAQNIVPPNRGPVMTRQDLMRVTRSARFARFAFGWSSFLRQSQAFKCPLICGVSFGSPQCGRRRPG